MPDTSSRRLIGELTFPEISQHLGERSIVCLPIGSIEQHGPHLPLNTDVVLAEEFTRRIVARWAGAYDLWQLPTISVSLAREHEWAPGTLSLSIQGMTALIRDLGREIARSLPTRNLAVVNGHGGNRGILDALALDLRADFGLNLCVIHPAVWLEGETQGTAPEIHGGRNETSLMLAVAPHLVRREAMAQLTAAPRVDAVGKTILDPAVSWPWTTDDSRIADRGVIGDAQAATAAEGERMFTHAAEQAGPVFAQLLDNARLARR